MKTTIEINGEYVSVTAGDEDMPLLWLLRDELGLTGTKFGCGIGVCGACTVHLDDNPVRACSMTVKQAAGSKITTIEGLKDKEGNLHPVQEAWMQVDVPQCGYCQAGQIMTTVAMLKQIPNPTDEQIDQQMMNICRCGTYQRIRKAIHIAADTLAKNTVSEVQEAAPLYINAAEEIA